MAPRTATVANTTTRLGQLALRSEQWLSAQHLDDDPSNLIRPYAVLANPPFGHRNPPTSIMRPAEWLAIGRPERRLRMEPIVIALIGAGSRSFGPETGIATGDCGLIAHDVLLRGC